MTRRPAQPGDPVPPLFARPEPPRRDGETFDQARDGARLAEQHARVWAVVKDGLWHTAAELERATGDNWASVSARLRDFRKVRFGGHAVERRCLGGGTFEYRVVVRKGEAAA